MKAIIIDDNHLVLKGLKLLIPWDDLGIELVDSANNGLEGYTKIMDLSPDLIITDIRMPKMTGLELCKKLVNYPGEIIILSAFEDFSYAKEAMSLGVQNYILKPITQEKIEELCLVLKRLKTSYAHKQNYIDTLIEGKIEELLLQGLNQQNQKMISTFFEHTLHTLYQSPSEANQLAIRIINVIYRYFNDIGFNAESILSSKANKTKEILNKKNPDDIFLAIRELYIKIMQFSEEKDDEDGLVEHCMAIIKEEFVNTELSVTYLADKLFVSPNYLSQLFKKRTAQTISGYIIQLRMNKSISLLKNPNLSIKDVTSRVGYNDSRYFAKAFKKHTGYTPTHYREKITYLK